MTTDPDRPLSEISGVPRRDDPPPGMTTYDLLARSEELVLAKVQLAELKEKNRELREALSECQWAYDGQCWFCERFSQDGHASDCKLARLLRGE